MFVPLMYLIATLWISLAVFYVFFGCISLARMEISLSLGNGSGIDTFWSIREENHMVLMLNWLRTPI